MNARSLAMLTGATALVGAVAVLTLHHRENAVRATTESRKLFPDLAASLNDVVTVKIQRKDGPYTLQKIADAWGLAENRTPFASAIGEPYVGIATEQTPSVDGV